MTESKSSTARGYNYRWQQESKIFLRYNPLCVRCEELGETVGAEVVDHIVPHKGDMELFWDVGNWQSLCKKCHDRKTATEDGGLGRGDGARRPDKSCGIDGVPHDSSHHWSV